MKCINISCRLALSYLFFTLLIFFNAKALELQEERLIENNYEEIKLLVYRLVSEYPPPHYLYVGVGRSPTPLIAFLQAIDSKVAINFPLSFFRKDAERDYIGEKNLKILHRHFEEFFGRYRKKGKVIVFIDYVISGATLFSVQKHYQNFSNKDTSYPRSLSVGLSEIGVDIPIFFRDSHIPAPRMFHLGSDFVDSMRDQDWKSMAEYERADLTTLKKHPPRKISPRSYRALKIRLMAKQQEDESSKFLEILHKLSLSDPSGNCLRLMQSLL